MTQLETAMAQMIRTFFEYAAADGHKKNLSKAGLKKGWESDAWTAQGTVHQWEGMSQLVRAIRAFIL